MGVARGLVQRRRPVGTMMHTATAADAFFIVVLDRTVFGDVHGPRGADLHAGRVLTVIAGCGKMCQDTLFRQRLYPSEELPDSQLVLLLTGNLTSLTTDAARRVI